MGAIKKVFHIINGLGTGGAEKALSQLLLTSLSTGIVPIVVSMRGMGTHGKKLEENGISVIALGDGEGASRLHGILALVKLVRTLHPDVLQGWMYQGNLVALIVWLLTRRKTLLFWNIRHGLDDVHSETFLTRQSIRLSLLSSRFPHVTIYNSKNTMRQHKEYGFRDRFPVYIPNGFTPQKFSSHHKSVAKHSLGLRGGDLVVGHVGRYHKVKDQKTFIAAMAILMERFPRLCAVMVGKDVESCNKPLLDSVPSGLADRFHFLGERPDMNEIYLSLDILCITSLTEAFPNVLGEAMSYEIPTVTTDVGDCRLVQSGYGHVVAVGDIEGIVMAVQELVCLDSKGRSRIGKQARRHIEEKYSEKAVSEVYENLYRDLTSRVDCG